jgi:hypothetical protein
VIDECAYVNVDGSMGSQLVEQVVSVPCCGHRSLSRSNGGVFFSVVDLHLSTILRLGFLGANSGISQRGAQ